MDDRWGLALLVAGLLGVSVFFLPVSRDLRVPVLDGIVRVVDSARQYTVLVEPCMPGAERVVEDTRWRRKHRDEPLPWGCRDRMFTSVGVLAPGDTTGVEDPYPMIGHLACVYMDMSPPVMPWLAVSAVGSSESSQTVGDPGPPVLPDGPQPVGRVFWVDDGPCPVPRGRLAHALEGVPVQVSARVLALGSPGGAEALVSRIPGEVPVGLSLAVDQARVVDSMSAPGAISSLGSVDLARPVPSEEVLRVVESTLAAGVGWYTAYPGVTGQAREALLSGQLACLAMLPESTSLDQEGMRRSVSVPDGGRLLPLRVVSVALGSCI